MSGDTLHHEIRWNVRFIDTLPLVTASFSLGLVGRA
jgi:hypothetical protein